MDGRPVSSRSHVGGAPFTYVIMRWTLKGIRALWRWAELFQHQHASSSSRSRSAARRRKRRVGETKDTEESPLEVTQTES